MIPILCNTCDVHLYNLDQTALAWPLTFEMFHPVEPNNRLPHGKVHTDIFCPVCFGPPLPWDAGDGAMGKWLKVRGGDGKPVLIETAKLIEKWAGVPSLRVEEVSAPPVIKIKAKPKAKSGRKPKKPAVKTQSKQEIPKEEVPPELKAVMARVTQGQSEEPVAAVGKDEITMAKREQDRERDRLARDREQRPLRPYTGR